MNNDNDDVADDDDPRNETCGKEGERLSKFKKQ